MATSKLKFTTVLEYILTVLITKLAFDFLMYFLPVIQSTNNPYTDVLIGMGLTIVVFYPIYGLIHSGVEKVSKLIINTDGRKNNTQFIKITVVFLLVFVLLFAGFLKLKRDINLFEVIYNLFSLFHF